MAVDEHESTERAAFDAGIEDQGLRLDRFLAQRIPSLSRSRLKSLILEGRVTGASGTIGDPGHRVKSGDVFVLALPEPEPATPAPESMPLAIAYEDEHLIVIDKPAGLVVHPAAGHSGGTLVNALLAHCGESLSGIGGVRRPGIVHRLDKDTTGLLVAAKSDLAHRGLAEQFAAHGTDGRLRRAYQALVWGAAPRARGIIDANLVRSTTNRTKITVARASAGRRAVTHYTVLETFGLGGPNPKASHVELTLETGRTHQIRVHLAHIGQPVMGDAVYGAAFKASAATLSPRAQAALSRLNRQALHASELGFEHPVTRAALSFTSPLPADMAALLAALRQSAPNDKRKARRR